MSSPQTESFRQSMRRMAATVCIVTCEHEGERYGITVTSVTPLSFDPLSVLVCLNNGASVSDPLLKKTYYCINILQNSQALISKRFSGGVAPAERFLAGDWSVGIAQTPYLADAQANLFCQIDQTLAYATHQIVIGRVLEARFSEAVAPLVYQNGQYAACAPLQLSGAA